MSDVARRAKEREYNILDVQYKHIEGNGSERRTQYTIRVKYAFFAGMALDAWEHTVENTKGATSIEFRQASGVDEEEE